MKIKLTIKEIKLLKEALVLMPADYKKQKLINILQEKLKLKVMGFF